MMAAGVVLEELLDGLSALLSVIVIRRIQLLEGTLIRSLSYILVIKQHTRVLSGNGFIWKLVVLTAQGGVGLLQLQASKR